MKVLTFNALNVLSREARASAERETGGGDPNSGSEQDCGVTLSRQPDSPKGIKMEPQDIPQKGNLNSRVPSLNEMVEESRAGHWLKVMQKSGYL